MGVHFAQIAPVLVGQTHDAVADAQLVFADDGGSAFAQQFVVMEQAAGDGVLYGHHPDDIAVLADAFKDVFEGIATDQFNLVVLEELVGGNVVVRSRNSLYCYLFHFDIETLKKIPSSFRRRDFVILSICYFC